jgi:hypothetical protein
MARQLSACEPPERSPQPLKSATRASDRIAPGHAHERSATAFTVLEARATFSRLSG